MKKTQNATKTATFQLNSFPYINTRAICALTQYNMIIVNHKLILKSHSIKFEICKAEDKILLEMSSLITGSLQKDKDDKSRGKRCAPVLYYSSTFSRTKSCCAIRIWQVKLCLSMQKIPRMHLL